MSSPFDRHLAAARAYAALFSLPGEPIRHEPECADHLDYAAWLLIDQLHELHEHLDHRDQQELRPPKTVLPSVLATHTVSLAERANRLNEVARNEPSYVDDQTWERYVGISASREALLVIRSSSQAGKAIEALRSASSLKQLTTAVDSYWQALYNEAGPLNASVRRLEKSLRGSTAMLRPDTQRWLEAFSTSLYELRENPQASSAAFFTNVKTTAASRGLVGNLMTSRSAAVQQLVGHELQGIAADGEGWEWSVDMTASVAADIAGALTVRRREWLIGRWTLAARAFPEDAEALGLNSDTDPAALPELVMARRAGRDPSEHPALSRSPSVVAPLLA